MCNAPQGLAARLSIPAYGKTAAEPIPSLTYNLGEGTQVMAPVLHSSIRDELISKLREWSWSDKLEQKRKHHTVDLTDLVQGSVGANTFRGFAGVQPSRIFRPWAEQTFSGTALAELLGIQRQTDYDEWIERLATSLENRWKAEAPQEIKYGPKYKLVNLLLKALCESAIIPDDAWQKLVWLIHVPLDRYVLLSIRSCGQQFSTYARIGSVPKNPSMNFIKNSEEYRAFQQGIRELADRAGVPPITLDYVAWNDAH